MKKIGITLIVLVCSSSGLFSQMAPPIEWQNTIGGNALDWLYSMRQTSDGGYIVGGQSASSISGDKTENSNGWDDYWILKLNTSGGIVWQNTIGGNEIDYLMDLKQTSDGGYIVGGSSRSNISGDKTENCRGNFDYWVIKLDSIGNIIWQKTLGGTGLEELYTIQQTVDGGYILGGHSTSNISGDKTENSNGLEDFWVIKLNSAGTIVWQNTIGGNNDDRVFWIQQTSDLGYILGGQSSSNISGDKTENLIGASDYWVVKLDSAGNILWQNTIGGSLTDGITSIKQTNDGGYIVGGVSNSNISGDKTQNSRGLLDYWVIKLNSIGSIVWQRTIGGSNYDELQDVEQTSDGGYILGGQSHSNISGEKTENSNGIYDYWVIKLNTTGGIVWQNTIGGNVYDNLQTIQQTADGGYMLGGYSFSSISGDKTENSNGDNDYWVIKLAPECNTYSINSFIACESYLWNGNIYTLSGTYLDTITNLAGCDSIMTLNLTILNSSHSFDTIISCDSYTWNGNTYSTTGIYNDSIPNHVGCDSIMTLNLTILNSTHFFDTVLTCDSFIWNETTYITTGVYTYTIPNHVGCDSVVTLNLTILTSTHSFDTISTCDPFVWNETTYTTTGIYTDTIPNNSGCDSSMTLNLTILPSPVPTISFDGDSSLYTSTFSFYQWYNCLSNTTIAEETNQSFSPAADGSYAVIVTNGFGCIDTSSCYLFADTSHASIETEEFENQYIFSLYPNPTFNFITIESNVDFLNSEIIIFNSLGEVILSFKNTNKISIENLAQGIYYLRLKFIGGEKGFKILKN